MNRHLILLICAGLILLSHAAAFAQRGSFEPGQNPAHEGEKIVKKIVRYDSSEYDDKNSGELIAGEVIKREILESIRPEVMSSFRHECPGQTSFSSQDFTTLISSVFTNKESEARWEDDVLEYQSAVGVLTSDLAKDVAKIICVISSDKFLTQHIKKNQKYADDALEKIFELQNNPYSRSKQSAYDREINVFRATNYFKQGVLLTIAKNYEEAIENFTSAIDLNPRFPEAFYQRALLYIRGSDNNKALSDYSQAIRLDQNELIYYTSRARCYLVIGSLDPALNDLNKALEMNPPSRDLYNIYYLRGRIHDRKKDNIKALQDYSKAIEINPDAIDSHYRKGLVNRRLKNYEESIEDFNHAIELNKRNGNAYFERGTTYAYLNDKGNLIKDFKSAARYGNAEAREFLESKNIKWD